MPAKKPKTTVKQAKLIKGIASGKTKRQAGIDAGYSGTPETVSVTVSDVLRKPNVQEALYAEMERQGITLEKVIQPVTNALNSVEVEMQLKGHDRAIRLIMPKTAEGTTNYNFINVARADKDEFGI